MPRRTTRGATTSAGGRQQIQQAQKLLTQFIEACQEMQTIGRAWTRMLQTALQRQAGATAARTGRGRPRGRRAGTTAERPRKVA